MKVIVLADAWPAIPLLIREMCRQGIEVLYLSPDVPSASELGRYCRQRRAPGMHDPGYRGYLLSVLESEPFDYLLPLCDVLQHLAWDLPPAYAGRVFPALDPAIRRLFTDRRMMYRFVRELGIATPRAVDSVDVGALAAIGDTLGWPLVLRGIQGCGGSQVSIVADEATARTAAARLSRSGPVFAQEFIRGDLYVAGALADRGQVRQLFVAKAIENWPSPTGPAIRVLSVDDPALRRLCSRLFAALHGHGLIMADFIRRAHGEPCFLEVNLRFWGSIHAADICGARLIESFVKLLRGAPLPPARTYAVGRRVTLFPQFVTARLDAGAFPRIADLPHYFAMLASLRRLSIPLLRHYLRRLYWHYAWHRSQ